MIEHPKLLLQVQVAIWLLQHRNRGCWILYSKEAVNVVILVRVDFLGRCHIIKE